MLPLSVQAESVSILISRNGKGKQWLSITAFVLSFFSIVSLYADVSSLTGAPLRTLLKPKAVFKRTSLVKSRLLIFNKSNTIHPQVEIKTENERKFAKNYDEYRATSTDKEIFIIDLDKTEPPLNFLYEKLTLVTSFSENHFQEGLGFIGSAQQQMPNKTIIVYDLGLKEHSSNQIRSFCNVQLRRFPFESYPAHLKTLATYAFKPTIINLVLNEFGVIYYGDASIRFKKPLFELLPDCVNHHGFLGQIRCFDPKVLKSKYGCRHDYGLTKEEIYGKIGVNKTEYYNANFSSPAISGGLMLVINSSSVQSKIMRPWLSCALDVTCIAPHGANLGNHRFDQSALSLIAFKNMRGEWTLENDPTPHHNAVVSVLRGSNGAKWRPQSCS
ncbi:hypothetical protein HOLleu_01622 [Holothuria leucospilota]|uniref:Uncharacterized protein n=1 Tax=Holothuria leucospilota TaxID=206669 RepID=A0A9Q1CPK9_HOLLE|nr:hypothetical protein HOLleu_01622 [Holothuria leucospilota]